jgi:peptidyl-prolyl cis-trans isomerase C
MPKASARHILVETEEECRSLKEQIVGGADFADIAAKHSLCPSGQQGGELGEFHPGQMVKEFDTVVFNEDVGVVHGPVRTQFGYHLIEITARGGIQLLCLFFGAVSVLFRMQYMKRIPAVLISKAINAAFCLHSYSSIFPSGIPGTASTICVRVPG